MKTVAEYINTCASFWDADTIGFDMSAVGIVAARGYTLRVNGTSGPFNIFQKE